MNILIDFIMKKISVAHDAMWMFNILNLGLTDDMAHFWFFGILGLILIFVFYPFFKFLAKKQYYLMITFINIFLIILFSTLVIEVGQDLTCTGDMQLSDFLYGVAGFIFFFIMYLIFRLSVLIIKKIITCVINKHKKFTS